MFSNEKTREQIKLNVLFFKDYTNVINIQRAMTVLYIYKHAAKVEAYIH